MTERAFGMAEKKSFVVHVDTRQHLDLLDRGDRGDLFTAMLDYAATGKHEPLSDKAAMAFSFIRAQIDRDTKKWEAIVERNRINGAKSGAAKQPAQLHPVGPDNGTGTENETETANGSD